MTDGPGPGGAPTRSEHDMRKILTTSAVALSTAALTIGLAGTAQAERHRVGDPADTGHGSDVRALKVRNGEENLVIKTTHRNLRRDPRTGTGGSVFIDTDPSDRGPEYVFVGGYTMGTDYALLETDGFHHRSWGEPVSRGTYVLRVDYRADTVRMRMSRAAVGDPSAVRVAVKVAGLRRDGSHDGLVDWVGAPRSFTPWIARG